ncbi:uncharacterized protein LOC132203594 [Neocloeon triangulifer]|uniref:uncharacterized protein LOC132203594 n=1 Tax=Neocloeon triangulifer TaxID=2078957 RepID=UPI00286F3836|nr:uncharacterized protein LOC132203594 [Neocloeon triangulifer]
MASPRAGSDATPICRCRVLYLGSSVPHITKDGLQGIQEPLRELYPEQGASGARGIDSWLSVWSNGLLLENVDENHKKVTRFFPIDSLHYCAAVRYVMVPNSSPNMAAPPRFLPLDSPFARYPNAQHPPLFAAILRRTTGIKVLECHAFICKREMAANALVKCCFHAYADASYAKQIDAGSRYGTLQPPPAKAGSVLGEAASSIEKVEGWRTNGASTNGTNTLVRNEENTPGIDDISIYNGDENHKVWAGAEQGDFNASTLRSTRSSRPRQMMQPGKTPPPPPPPQVEETSSKKGKSKKKQLQRDPELINGGAHTLMRPVRGAHSVSGTLMRPINGHPPPMNGYGPPPMLVMHPQAGRHVAPRLVGTFSHRPKQLRPVPPPFIPPPPPSALMTTRRPVKHYQEEPIYMPSAARPLSPVASYQPGHFPHETYLAQMMPPMGNPYVPMETATLMRNTPANVKKRSKSKKMSRQEQEDESPFNTGIYRKKGHMNERAFSYSIRQEHRSRSYGSLASLKFENGGGDSPGKEDSKKEREIIQMMQDLDMSGEEPPPPPHVNGNGHPMMNGMNGSHPMMNGSHPIMNGNGYESRPMRATVGRR